MSHVDAEIVKEERITRPELWTIVWHEGNDWHIYQYAQMCRSHVEDDAKYFHRGAVGRAIVRIPPESEQQIDWKKRAVELANRMRLISSLDPEGVSIKLANATLRDAGATP